ncbi:class I SAM-dependent methyltransferase [Nocardioides panacisoli]|uniref:Class I SAM-dependent methyltransferase n=1 Tax=Nocardioides panacisoli TaxID=627624 RepID=A0ABP7IC87_9ACTN
MSIASFELVFGHALRGEECHLVPPDGRPLRLPVEDWTATPDRSDLALLAHCSGATLDIGCGPGRLTAELAARGQVVLGIDVVGEAVGQARSRGGSALVRDVFDRVPGEGRWQTVLLADGNIGIGGDPSGLLERVRQLLDPRGHVVVEVAGPGVPTRTVPVRLQCSCAQTGWFRWSVVGVDGVAALAASAGLALLGCYQHGVRWWAVLGETW